MRLPHARRLIDCLLAGFQKLVPAAVLWGARGSLFITPSTPAESRLACRRGRWMQVDASEDPFELVAMQDWEQLALLHGPEGDDLFQSR